LLLLSVTLFHVKAYYRLVHAMFSANPFDGKTDFYQMVLLFVLDLAQDTGLAKPQWCSL
jgi:hypothetical protein